MKINNQQAFTSTNKTSPYGDGETIYDNEYGMTLLDYFAAKSMQGLCVNVGRNGYALHKPEVIAKECYSLAKAMLVEREKVLKGLQDEPHAD